MTTGIPRGYLVLLDLDRTLLDTDRFASDLLTTLAAVAKTGADEVARAWRKGDSGDGVLHTVNLAAICALLGIDPADVAAAMRRLPRHVRQRWLFPDAPDLLATLATLGMPYAVLTFGEETLQRAKLDAIGLLAGVESHITDGRKNDYIRSRWAGRHGMLVDDKPGQDLPDGWDEVLLDRTSPHDGARRLAPGRWQVGSLDWQTRLAPVAVHLDAPGFRAA